MSLLISTLPDDPESWASWLEQQLFGDRFRDLIAESMEARADDGAANRPRLADLLSDEQLQAIRSEGLTCLDSSDVLVLLGAPEALLDLEEDILIEGGEYWSNTLQNSGHSQAGAELVNEVLTRTIQDAPSPQVAATGAVDRPTPVAPGQSRSKLWLLALGALAAGLLVGIALQYGGGKKTLTGILGDPTEIVQHAASPADFFGQMAQSCDTWFEHTQEIASTKELESLLVKMNANFEALVKTNSLSDPERTWFTTKCEKWQDKVDVVIAGLRDGSTDFSSSLESANKIVTAMTGALLKGPSDDELQAIRDASV